LTITDAGVVDEVVVVVVPVVVVPVVVVPVVDVIVVVPVVVVESAAAGIPAAINIPRAKAEIRTLFFCIRKRPFVYIM
jgi:hypothetical protein